MKLFGGVEVKLHAFLTLAQVGGEWSASHSGHCTHEEGSRCASESVWMGWWKVVECLCWWL